MTSHAIKLGDTNVAIQSDDFADGIRTGYIQFLVEYENESLSDADIYGIIAQNIYSVRRTNTYNAGYVTGWIKGLLEVNPRQHTPQAVIQALAEPSV
jgi:hypothetical protein